MRDVFVLGVGMIKFGRFPEKDVHELAAEAALLALKDAGMTVDDIQLLASGNLFQSMNMIGQRILVRGLDHSRAEVRGHYQHGVLEIDHASLAVR